MCWHQNIILRNDCYCKQRKQAEADPKPSKVYQVFKELANTTPELLKERLCRLNFPK